MNPRNPVADDPTESAPRRIQSGLKTLLTLTFRSVRLLALGAGLMVWLAGSPAQAGSWETCLGAEALTAEAACSEAILQADGTADRHALAYEARGRSRMLAGRLDAAIADFTAALDLAPGKPAILHVRATAYLAGGHNDLAQADIAALIALDPGRASSYVLRSLYCDTKGDPTRRLEDLNHAIALDSSAWPAYFYRSHAYRLNKDFKKSLDDITKAIELEPGFAWSYYHRAAILNRLPMNYLEGILYVSDVQKAIAVAPDFAPAHALLGAHYVRSDLPDKAIATLNEALDIHSRSDNGKFAHPLIYIYKNEAFGLYFGASERRRNLSDIYLQRGRALHQQKKYNEAIRDFTEASTLAPNAADIRLSRAISFRALKDYAAAISDLDDVIAAGGADSEAFYLRARSKADSGMNAESLADFAKTIELSPKDGRAFNNRGIAQWKLGKPDAALVDFQRAIDIDPTVVTPRRNKGKLLYEQGKNQLALVEYSKVIELRPNDSEAFAMRAEIHERLKHPDQARADYVTMVRLRSAELRRSPDDATALNERGWALAKLGRPDLALIDAERALTIRPRDAHMLDTRGYALLKLGRIKEAIADFKAALDIKPGRTAFLEHLAEAEAALRAAKR